MRTPTGTLLRAGLTAVVSLALVAGCTDDPKPGTLKAPTASPTSTSASPTPTTPGAQIEAAVRAYYAELTRAARSGDATKLSTMTTTSCPCYRPVRVIKQNLEHGYITPDANFQVVSVRVHDVETGVGLAEVRTREAPYDVLNGDKKVVGHVDARENFLDLSMVQQEAGEWVIANQFDLMGDP
jgi:hypothetical protein